MRRRDWCPVCGGFIPAEKGVWWGGRRMHPGACFDAICRNLRDYTRSERGRSLTFKESARRARVEVDREDTRPTERRTG